MKSRKPTAKPASPPRQIAKLHPISEEMRQWSALLEAELLTWPRVAAKPMFGFRSFYRGKTIFAAIPRSREFDPRGSLMVRFNPMPEPLLKKVEEDPRVGSWARIPGRGWITFTLHSGDDLRDALWWLQRAHAAAGSSRPS
jgi:hypothetical protein